MKIINFCLSVLYIFLSVSSALRIPWAIRAWGYKLRLKIQRQKFYYTKTKHLRLTIIGGVAEYSGEKKLEILLKKGDDALYGAKNNGRNRVETG